MTYNEFIQNIINTRGQWNIPEGEYYENHHIIPVCLGGEPKNFNHKSKHKNLIWLTPEEHFIAHKLLLEENKNNIELQYAFNMMSNFNKIGFKEYSELRSGWHHSEETKEKIGNSNRGKKHSDEENLKNSIGHIEYYNKPGSREKTSKAMRSYISSLTDEERVNKYSSRNRSVICVEDNTVYNSVKELAEILNVTSSAVKNYILFNKNINGKHYKYNDNKQIDYTWKFKKVLCVETGIVYNSIREASIAIGGGHISDCCNGKRKTTKGYHWEWYN